MDADHHGTGYRGAHASAGGARRRERGARRPHDRDRRSGLRRARRRPDLHQRAEHRDLDAAGHVAGYRYPVARRLRRRGEPERRHADRRRAESCGWRGRGLRLPPPRRDVDAASRICRLDERASRRRSRRLRPERHHRRDGDEVRLHLHHRRRGLGQAGHALRTFGRERTGLVRRPLRKYSRRRIARRQRFRGGVSAHRLDLELWRSADGSRRSERRPFRPIRRPERGSHRGRCSRRFELARCRLCIHALRRQLVAGGWPADARRPGGRRRLLRHQGGRSHLQARRVSRGRPAG